MTTPQPAAVSEWRDVAALRAWLEHDGDIDGEALPIRSVLARLDRAPGPAADRVETAARLIHSRRHPLGYGHTCDRCRADAEAVAAVLTGETS